MRDSAVHDWPPLVLALLGTLLVLALASGPQAQASDRLFQTVPTPTPRSVPTPARIVTPRPGQDETPVEADLDLRQTVSPQDILPGEELAFALWLTNTSPAAVTGIILADALDPILNLLEVRATQGAVWLEDGSAYVHVGTLESGHTALIILRARVGSEAQAGHIILNQLDAHFDGGEATSNIVAAGLPPSVLPATGREGRGP